MEQRETNHEVEINFKELVGVVLRRSWIMVLAAILLATIAFLVSKYSLTPMYLSTTQIYVMSQQDSSATVTYNDLQTSSQLTNDYMTLIKSRPVTQQVIEKLGLGLKHNKLAEMITVTNPTNTRILNITIQYPDPYWAKMIADSIRDAAAIHIQNVMNIDYVSVVEDANLPDKPSSPSILRNTLLGGILGVILSGFVIVLIFMLNDTIKTPEDIERYLGLSVLSSIPTQKHLKKIRTKEKKHKKNPSIKASSKKKAPIKEIKANLITIMEDSSPAIITPIKEKRSRKKQRRHVKRVKEITCEE